MDVTVIDDSDGAGWLVSALHSGDISTSTTISGTISRILTHIGHRKMSSLTIIDHGDTSNAHLGFQIGNEWIKMDNIATHSGQLSRLNGKFTNGGYVVLRACEIGFNQPLLLEVSKILDVPVHAYTGRYNALRMQLGRLVRAYPDGRIIKATRGSEAMDGTEAWGGA